ncbi:DUF6385 domain-containing protein [Desulforudis sp. 1088]|uniref:DUF6385 domain-containing protein n=1 Tax=unclassified Candidatus Desulforudis TaxID=2635950 RepID=UPI003CE522D4
MPNFKIFQDNADQARVKIFGSQNVALNTDSSGRAVVTAPAEGLAITPPSGGLSITPPTGGLSITPPTNGLTVTAPAEGLSITPPSGGLSITPPSGGLSITPPSGGLSITPPSSGLLITSPGLAVESTLATTEVQSTVANFSSTAGAPDTAYNIMEWKTYTFGVVNNSLAANAQATVKLQISPDATNWIDHAGPVTLNQGAVDAVVASIFLKYARVYYAAVNSNSAVTLNIFFQAQT